ncbi:class I SAM-dependent methyltransferase [Mangrovihabitans endophyticus]|nr:methyltransferase domain-containing protein [Mangrovihabitans endophyticus]
MTARTEQTSPTISPPSWRSPRFLTEALRSPHQIGAIARSGRRLAAHAAGLIAARSGPQTVVELGPGDGALTVELQRRLPADSNLIAVEVNTAMAEHLSHTLPWLKLIHGDAADLPKHLAEAGLGRADLIVSALPWSVFNVELQQRLMGAIVDGLEPGGTFATVQTVPVKPLPRARHFRRLLNKKFDAVLHTSTVWRNMPPAHLYVCRNPSGSAAPAAGVAGESLN